jgi:hypothetical protein
VSIETELQDMAGQLAGAAWRTKPEREWTPVERAAYDRWAGEALAEMRAGEYGPVRVMSHEEGENAVGEFVRFTVRFDGDSLGPDDASVSYGETPISGDTLTDRQGQW